MSKSKQKPSAKDLLKKTFAHKNGNLNQTESVLGNKDKVDATAVFSEKELDDQPQKPQAAPIDPTPAPTHIHVEEAPPTPLDDDLPSDLIEEVPPTPLDEDLLSDSSEFLDDNETQTLAELEAPTITYLDDLVDAATKASIFDDEPTLLFGENQNDDAPPELDDYSIVQEDVEHPSTKNAESLSLLDRVKADKDAKKREYLNNLKQLEAISSEQNELEEIMRQQLLKQQKEEADKLNEGIERIRTRFRNFLNLLREIHSLEQDEILADSILNIAQDFKENQTINLQSYLLINRSIHKYKITYDLDEVRVFLNEDLLNISVPPLDFDYYYLWESDLNKKITPYMWDKHKMRVFEEANYVCELCGGTGEHNPVELYPNWKIFDNSRVLILNSFLALCPKCVDAKNHNKLKERGLKMRYESAREHIKTVNNWDDRQVENALLDADESYMRRVDEKADPERFKKWKLNVSVLETIFNIKIDEPNFHQRSHIKSPYHNIFEHHVNYLFGKIESDRMIKTGKTKFISIKLIADRAKQ